MLKYFRSIASYLGFARPLKTVEHAFFMLTYFLLEYHALAMALLLCPFSKRCGSKGIEAIKYIDDMVLQFLISLNSQSFLPTH